MLGNRNLSLRSRRAYAATLLAGMVLSLCGGCCRVPVAGSYGPVVASPPGSCQTCGARGGTCVHPVLDPLCHGYETTQWRRLCEWSDEGEWLPNGEPAPTPAELVEPGRPAGSPPATSPQRPFVPDLVPLEPLPEGMSDLGPDPLDSGRTEPSRTPPPMDKTAPPAAPGPETVPEPDSPSSRLPVSVPTLDLRLSGPLPKEDTLEQLAACLDQLQAERAVSSRAELVMQAGVETAGPVDSIDCAAETPVRLAGAVEDEEPAVDVAVGQGPVDGDKAVRPAIAEKTVVNPPPAQTKARFVQYIY